jgi:uncharacterized repeat protein (TIGR03803 family)
MSKTHQGARRAVALVMYTIAAYGETFTTLYNFNNGSYGPGPNPLVQGVDGNIYGTTFYGGTQNAGTIFMVTPTGEFSTLYNFCSVTNCADGANPEAQLTVGSDGNLYGTTTFGGGAPECSLGCGTIFRFSNGTLTTLHAFMDNINGSIPQPGLVAPHWRGEPTTTGRSLPFRPAVSSRNSWILILTTERPPPRQSNPPKVPPSTELQIMVEPSPRAKFMKSIRRAFGFFTVSQARRSRTIQLAA